MKDKCLVIQKIEKVIYLKNNVLHIMSVSCKETDVKTTKMLILSDRGVLTSCIVKLN